MNALIPRLHGELEAAAIFLILVAAVATYAVLETLWRNRRRP